MSFYKNKRAAERYLSPYMILVWAMIGVAIIIGIMIFYSVKFDVREREADILAVRLADCLVDQGYLRKDVNKSNEFDIFSKCNLEKTIIKNGDYYFKVSFSDPELDDIFDGVKNFEMLCELGKDAEGENFPKCSRKKIYALKDGEKVIIEILVGSKQLGKKL